MRVLAEAADDCERQTPQPLTSSDSFAQANVCQHAEVWIQVSEPVQQDILDKKGRFCEKKEKMKGWS